jgi:hypothetical protein
MKKTIVFSMAIIVLSAFVMALGAPYDLTKVDIFGLKKKIDSADISFYGVTLKDTKAEALKKFNKTESDVSSKGGLMVEPGLIVAFFQDHIEKIMIDERFKDKLVGVTAKLYDNIDTEKKFKTYMDQYVWKPDKYEATAEGGMGNTKVILSGNIEISRLSWPGSATCTIEFFNR